MKDKRFRYGFSVALCVFLLATSCSKDEITYYEIPKEPASGSDMMMPADHPPIQADASMSAMQAPQSDVTLTWTSPEGWVDGKVSSMRLGSYKVAEMGEASPDISVTRFPGDVGGLFSNVNRWRGQLGMERLADPSELGPIPTLETEHFKFKMVELTHEASPATSTMVAVLDLDGFSWFFKITGSKDAVNAERERFETFIRSVERGDSAS